MRDYEKIGVKLVDAYDGKRGVMVELPKEATHAEILIDYSGCYYQGDKPDCVVTFYREKSI